MTAATSTAVAGALTGVSAVTILCHVRPDADTIGSGLALGGLAVFLVAIMLQRRAAPMIAAPAE